MMSGKDESQAVSAGRKPQEPAPKCPRCDSSNTKFCYYNNYSLAQPRHFCKTCRRYWTKGGALRNVPIGGGCRKSKKIKPSSSGSSSDVGGLKFFQGVSPAMDFQLNFPKMSPNTALFNGPFDNLSHPCYDPNSAGTSSLNFHNTLTTSIESLSSINQDLHWNLQRQRLGMLFGGDNTDSTNTGQHENNYTLPPSFETHVQNQKPQPILFQNLDISKRPEISCGNIIGGGGENNISQLSTEWFFDNSYATPNPTSGGGLDEDTNNWNGIQDFY